MVKGIKNIVIKVGTSVLTRQRRFDERIIGALSGQMAQILDGGAQVAIVSSGAIGAGMTLLKLKTRPAAMEALQGAAAVGQRYLMQCYEKAFSRHGYSTAQVLLTWSDLAERRRFLNAKRTLRQIQQWGLVPVINENDTVATDEIRFGDNDRLSSLLAILAEADVLIILSDTDGLYADGGRGGRRQRIPVVQRMEPSIFSHVKDHNTSYTVGGMRSKLTAIYMSVSSGIPVFLANGRDKRVLTRIFSGEDIGTLFVPHVNSRGRRHWLKYFMNHVRPGKKL